MDRLTKLLNQKVSASSLIEVSVALVLSGIVFTVAIMIFMNVARFGLSNNKIKYHYQLQALANRDIQNGNFLSEQIAEGPVMIVKRISYYQSNPNLIHIEYTAINSMEKNLAVYRRLVYVE